MTRLSVRQRMVLSELAHMRVPREDAWMTTTRLARLADPDDGSRSTVENFYGLLVRLEKRGFVERKRDLWRITDAGREAL